MQNSSSGFEKLGGETSQVEYESSGVFWTAVGIFLLGFLYILIKGASIAFKFRDENSR